MPAEEKVYRIHLRIKDEEKLREVPINELDTACMGGLRRQEDGSFELVAHARDSVVAKLKRARGVKVDVLADLAEEAKKVKGQIGRRNRFTDKDAIPRGFGKKVREEEQR